jgi:adenosylcobinamide-phosphate synthase
MTRTRAIAAIYLLDWVAGDPEWFPHPVRFIGRGIQLGEAALRRAKQSAAEEVLAGGMLTAAIVSLSYVLTAKAIASAYRLGRAPGMALEIFLGGTCLATRNLIDESLPVMRALEHEDLPRARERLARIVGRDTAHLNETEIARAVIETLAESSCDGIAAPLFYLTVGGVPLAMAYKAVNTLDSMIGHADEKYFYFGKVAARLDDAANLIPSRLTALALTVVSGTNCGVALRTWLRDGLKHKSPNAGQTESAMAGALQVRLGGDNTYDGERVKAPLMGAEFPQPAASDARRALRFVVAASLLTAIAAIGVQFCRERVAD